MAENVVAFKPKPSRVQEDDICIDEGNYRVVHVDSYSYPWRAGTKLTLLFRIIEPGAHHGKVLARHYNVARTKSGFRAGRRTDLVRELQQVTGRRIERLDRLPIGMLKDLVILARVRTVSRDSKGQHLQGINHYSVIGELIKEAK